MTDLNGKSKPAAIIGASIRIKGELSGSEDLLIQGKVEGSVVLNEHVVIVGSDAEVAADISAREVQVEGQVTGNLSGAERVVVRATGKVRGNISSPCLSLEEGAQLKGSIDTEVRGQERVTVTVEDTSSRREKAQRANLHTQEKLNVTPKEDSAH